MTTVAQKGAQAASGLVLPGAQSAEGSLHALEQQRDALVGEMEPLQQQLLSFAAWARRSASVTRLIASLAAGARQSVRLFLLAPYPTELLVQWGAAAEITALFHEGAAKQMTTWQAAAEASLPHGQLEIVLWNDAEALGGLVWTRVHGVQKPAFFTIPDEPAFYPAGLLDALRRGRVLLPRGRAGQNVNLDDVLDKLNANTTSEHAVIVESDGSVTSLVGALYANHTGAHLLVNHQPDFEKAFASMQVITSGFQKEQLSALAAAAYRYIGEHRRKFMQSQTSDSQMKQVAARLSILELPAAVPTPYSDQQFIQALSNYLAAQQAGAQQGYRYDDTQRQKDLAALQAQVSSDVSPHVRQAVANAVRVTAFTGGLPYSLADGFAGKAVGLVLRNLAAAYTLRCVAAASVQPPALTLALTLDPGLGQGPAPQPPDTVDRTVTLRGQAASLSNLAVLSSVLPLGAVLLHTQGGLDSMILGDARNRLREVHVSEIGSQVNMPSMPLVIYNAPLAWLTVGETLLEQGAGGFVGALWPLSDGADDDAVRLLLTAALCKGQNPAEALLNLPGFDQRISRAFVYLGTAAAWATPTNDPVTAVPAIYNTAARLAATGRAEMATLVYDRLRALTGEIAAGMPALRAEMLLLDADVQTRLTSRTRQRPAQEVADKAQQALDVLDKMSLPEQHKKALQVAMWERVAALDLITDNFERAGEMLQAARDAHHQSGQTAAELSTAFMLSVVQERQRQWAAARQTLLQVQVGLASTGNAVGLVSVATSLAYVSLPMAMYPDVVGHLKVAVQASLALGVQVLSETLLQTMQVGRAMAQMGAVADVASMARTLAGVVQSDKRLPEGDRTAIAGLLTLMQETAEVLQAGLPTEEREAKLSALVEKAQGSELAHSLGMEAWILSAGSPPTRDTETEGEGDGAKG